MRKITLLFSILMSTLYLQPALAIERINVSSTGEQADNNNPVRFISVNHNGRYTAYSSSATNLVENDTNDSIDVFLHDSETGSTKRISVSSTGEQANNNSYMNISSISDDGRFVLFASNASNLVENDTNNARDIFVHDVETAITSLISASSSGEVGKNDSYSATISADGRLVAFLSSASNLASDDTNSANDIFLHDRDTAQTSRINLSDTGQQADANSSNPLISKDGKHVVYASAASNIVATDTNYARPFPPGCSHDCGPDENGQDIFIHEIATKQTEIVNLASGIQLKYTGSYRISEDARYVFFDRGYEDGSGADWQLYRKDLETGKIVLANKTVSGQVAYFSYLSALSPDGRFALFNSTDENIVEGNISPGEHYYIHDFETGVTEIFDFSVRYYIDFSGDGSSIAFASDDSNLVANDTNNATDYFITESPLVNLSDNFIAVEKLINNETRSIPLTAAQLGTGAYFKQAFKVTNNSPSRIYQVNVFEDGALVCNLYALNPGQSKTACHSIEQAMNGNQNQRARVTAKVSGSSELLTSYADAYYRAHSNPRQSLAVTHRINNFNADSEDQAPILDSPQANVLFKVENTGDIELYKVKTYHDPVTPVNSGWVQQCVIGSLKPGQVRYCKRDLTLTETGLNQIMGRTQGANAIISATAVINANNPTYLIVP